MNGPPPPVPDDLTQDAPPSVPIVLESVPRISTKSGFRGPPIGPPSNGGTPDLVRHNSSSPVPSRSASSLAEAFMNMSPRVSDNLSPPGSPIPSNGSLQISETWAPNLTVYEKKEHRDELKDGENLCSVDGCLSPSELKGMCAFHLFHMAAQEERAAVHSPRVSAEVRVDTTLSLAHELIRTEQEYVKGLKAVSFGIVERLQAYIALEKPILIQEEVQGCFINLPQLYSVHADFYRQLKALRASHKLTDPELGKCIGGILPYFKQYTTYFSEVDSAKQKYQALKQGNKKKPRPEWVLFEQVWSKLYPGQFVMDILTSPVRRLPRYRIFLLNLQRVTSKEDPLQSELTKAVAAAENLSQEIEKSHIAKEARLRVVEVNRHMESGGMKISLVDPTRMHVRDGPVSKKNAHAITLSRWSRRWLFLFNDLLLITTVPSPRFKVKALVPLKETTIKELPDKDGKFCFEVTCGGKTWTLSAQSMEARSRWASDVRRCVDILRQQLATLAPSSPAVQRQSILSKNKNQSELDTQTRDRGKTPRSQANPVRFEDE